MHPRRGRRLAPRGRWARRAQTAGGGGRAAADRGTAGAVRRSGVSQPHVRRTSPAVPRSAAARPPPPAVWARGSHLRRAASLRPRRGSIRARYSSRSEEHTSELQSPCNLVCRLLLEKKKKSVYMSSIAAH